MGSPKPSRKMKRAVRFVQAATGLPYTTMLYDIREIVRDEPAIIRQRQDDFNRDALRLWRERFEVIDERGPAVGP